MKIIVTGSSGTIGNALCESLLAAGDTVIGVDRIENRWNAAVHRLTRYMDLRESGALAALPADADAVVHLAANARVYKLVEEPELARDNFLTTFNVLEFVRAAGIPRILFASSREVYGNSGGIIHSEGESYVRHCESAYTASKIAGEALVHSYNQCYGIDFIIARFSNVFGRYDYSDRVVPYFISKALGNGEITIFGRDKLLDFTYIDDAVRGLTLALQCFERAKNEVYNIATQRGHSIEDVARAIIESTGSDSRLVFGDNRTGEVCRFIADISKATAVIGYRPDHDLRSAIGRTIDWYATRQDAYRQALSSGSA